MPLKAAARALILSLAVAALAPHPAQAVTPDEMLPDASLEARARDISTGLRCVVCQNQSIDDSNAPLAHDLRVLVRERLTAGDSDRQAVDYIVARYGNFVLLRPPFEIGTLLLWLSPLLLLAGAVRLARRSMNATTTGSAANAAPLSEDESRRLKQLMDDA